jgi:hypothetical protein
MPVECWLLDVEMLGCGCVGCWTLNAAASVAEAVAERVSEFTAALTTVHSEREALAQQLIHERRMFLHERGMAEQMTADCDATITQLTDENRRLEACAQTEGVLAQTEGVIALKEGVLAQKEGVLAQTQLTDENRRLEACATPVVTASMLSVGRASLAESNVQLDQPTAHTQLRAHQTHVQPHSDRAADGILPTNPNQWAGPSIIEVDGTNVLATGSRAELVQAVRQMMGQQAELARSLEMVTTVAEEVR